MCPFPGTALLVQVHTLAFVRDRTAVTFACVTNSDRRVGLCQESGDELSRSRVPLGVQPFAINPILPACSGILHSSSVSSSIWVVVRFDGDFAFIHSATGTGRRILFRFTTALVK